MAQSILRILMFSLIAYIFLITIIKLWRKGKSFVIKQLAIACRNDFENKQYEKEIKKLRWLIWLNPTSLNYSIRAGIYKNLNQYDKAIKDISKAISINPNNAEYYENRAYYYSEMGENDLAIEDYNSAIDLKFTPKEDYSLFLFRAQSFEDNKEYQRAIKDYDIVIKHIPEEIEAYIGKGICLDRLEKYEEAIETFDQGIKIDDTDSALFVNKGNAFFSLQKHEKALLNYQKAIELDNNNYYAYYNRGRLYYDLKKVDEAFIDLNKALELDPSTEESYLFLFLGDLYAIVEKDNEKAMSLFQKAKELGNQHVQEHIDELNSVGTIIVDW